SSPNTLGSITSTSGIAVRMTFISKHLVRQDAQQVAAIAVLLQRLSQFFQLRRVDISLAESDLLWTGDLQSLPMFDGRDELPRLHQRLVRAGIQPRHAAPHDLHIQLSALQVMPVDVGN